MRLREKDFGSPRYMALANTFLKEQVRTSGLQEQLKKMGYASIVNWLKDNPGITYYELSDQVGVLPIILLHAHAFEAVECRSTRDCALEMFVREMKHELPNGWIYKPGNQLDIKARSAIVSVGRFLEDALAVKSDLAAADRVWKELLALNPPLGWLPKDIDDPIIQEAFARGWPENPQTSP